MPLDNLVQPKIRDNQNDNISDSERALSTSHLLISNQFVNAPKLNKRTMRKYLLLATASPYFAKYIIPLIENSKHIKGSFQKHCKDIILAQSQSLGNVINTEKQGILNKISHPFR